MHNGIIENFEPLRARLQQQGYAFVTADRHRGHRASDPCALTTAILLAAVCKTVAEFHGAYAIAAMTTREPGRIVGARAGSPLLVGIGERDHFLASDASALAPVTRRVVYLEEGDIADIGREGYAIYDAAGVRVAREVVTVKTSGDAVELGPYSHFMQKEIFEQPRVIADTLESVGGIGPELFGGRGGRSLRRRQRGARARLRHQLLLGHGRTAVARGRCRHTGAGRNRQRIPLSRQRAQSRCAGRRHFAVGRDGGHACRH